MIVPARLRTASGWGNACILNISSRGMLVHAGRPVARGSRVELRNGPYAIVARVVWQRGNQFGARAEERIPVEAIAASAVGSAPKIAGERRKSPRPRDSRIAGRTMEFATVAVIAGSLTAGLALTVEEALARPLGYIASALSR